MLILVYSVVADRVHQHAATSCARPALYTRPMVIRKLSLLNPIGNNQELPHGKP
jgi:hypothetical protein